MQRKYWFLISLTPFLVAADQGSKTVVENTLSYASKVTLIPGFFNLVYVRNPGMAFGLLNNLPEKFRLPLFLVVSVLAVIIIGHLFLQTQARAVLLPLALSLIFAGAVGNLIDRFRWGYVVDFLQLHYRHYYWPTFNVADTVISLGIALLIYDTLFSQDQSKTAGAPAPEAETEALGEKPEP
jgi:signal peptidase II